MRISDWSSDVCSSDLRSRGSTRRGRAAGRRPVQRSREAPPARPRGARRAPRSLHGIDFVGTDEEVDPHARRDEQDDDSQRHAQIRSEEHTYELQSLMRISYAAFGLKQKTTKLKQKNEM